MHQLTNVIQLPIIFVFITTVFFFKYLILSRFVKKGNMLYDPGHKFAIKDSEICALSKHFHRNQLLSPLIKVDSFSQNYDQNYYVND